MKTPPHLPPKTSFSSAMSRRQSVPAFVLIILVSLLAGAAGALVVAAWFVPVEFLPGQTFYSVGSNKVESVSLETDVESASRVRVMRVFDKRKLVKSVAYRDSAKVFEAATLSSDGWAVAYVPNYTYGSERYWEGRDIQGVAYDIGQVVFDPFLSLVYIQFADIGTRPFQVDSGDDIVADSLVWLLKDNTIKQAVLGDFFGPDGDSAHSIWNPVYKFALKDVWESGSLVLNEQGHFVGFVGSEDDLIPGWIVQLQFFSLLEEEKIVYKSIPWKGYIVDNVLKNDVLRRQQGFYISQLGRRQLESGARVGDIVIRIDGKDVNSISLARSVLLAPDTFTVTVLRGGEEVELTLEKTVVTP